MIHIKLPCFVWAPSAHRVYQCINTVCCLSHIFSLDFINQVKLDEYNVYPREVIVSRSRDPQLLHVGKNPLHLEKRIELIKRIE